MFVLWPDTRTESLEVLLCLNIPILSKALRRSYAMHLKSLLPLALLGLNPISQVAAESGYYNTCHDIGLGWSERDNDYHIRATCRLPSGIYNVDTWHH